MTEKAPDRLAVRLPARRSPGWDDRGRHRGIPTIPTITLRTVQSTSTTTCGGSTGTTTIAFLQVGSTVVISAPTNVAPNTNVTVGVVSLVLNEQIPVGGPDTGLTVNAVHVTVNTVGLAQTNVIVASSESDIGNCP